MSIKVGDGFRKNELSFQPGGSEVTVIKVGGQTLVYDKIKNVSAYCKRLKAKADVFEIKVDGVTYWKRNS